MTLLPVVCVVVVAAAAAVTSLCVAAVEREGRRVQTAVGALAATVAGSSGTRTTR